MRCTAPLALVLAVGGLAFQALAQPKLGEKRKPAAPPAAPISAPRPAPPGSPPLVPTTTPEGLPTQNLYEAILQQERGRRWTLKAEVYVGGLSSVVAGVAVPNNTGSGLMQIRTAAIIFPVPARTSSSQFVPSTDYTSELRFDGRILSAASTWIEGYPAGARFAKWTATNVDASEMRLSVAVPVVTYRTTINEELAAKVPWPKQMPPIATSALEPQLGVEFTELMGYIRRSDRALPPPATQIADTAKALTQKVKDWCGGQDPRKIPPYVLAKFLATRLLGEITISGNGFNANRDGSLQGFELKGALATLQEGRGSPHDLAGLLVAVYRAAGIPARTVIGLDVTGDRDNSRLARDRRERLVTWVEFALIDPTTNQEMWIPVDIVAMRNAGSRAVKFDQPIPYFGAHKDLDAYIPIALQYHPPTTVQAFGSPGFWGWNTSPDLASLEQSIRFFAFQTPRTSNEDPTVIPPTGPVK